MLINSITEINFRTGKHLHRRVAGTVPPSASSQVYSAADNTQETRIQLADAPQAELCGYIPRVASASSDSLFQKRKADQLSERASQHASKPWSVYAGTTGSFGKIDSLHQLPGLDFHSLGGLVGFDYAFSHAGLGVLLEYDHFKGKGAKHWGHTNIDQWHGSLYGIFSPATLPQLSVEAILGHSYEHYIIHRHTGTAAQPVTAKGSPNGYEYDALIGLEYMFSSHQGGFIAPVAYLQYVHEYASAYREQNAGTFNTFVDRQHLSSLASFLGARLTPSYYGNHWKLSIEVELLWQHEYLNANHAMGFTPIFAPIAANSIPTASLGRNLFLGGIDLFFIYNESWNLELNYDLQVTQHMITNSFYVGGGVQF